MNEAATAVLPVNVMTAPLRIGLKQVFRGLLGTDSGPNAPRVRAHDRFANQSLLETLEPRLLFSTVPVISEFMASNNDTLDDGDGISSDWIELYNPTASTVDLSGWHLTDRADNLDKWTFPTSATVPQDVLNLDPGEFLVVFASGQETEDYIDPEGNLHTDFRLGASGEYLALVQPGGVIVAHEYAPQYPPQTTDISYGLSFDGSTTVLIDEGASAQYIVPTGPIANWNTLSFNDSGWASGATGIGYEDSPEFFDSHIETSLGDSSDNIVTAYTRQTFQVANPAGLTDLTLHLRYDDGFLAYLNGVLVASENAPGNPQYNSNATGNHNDTAAVEFQPFDISDHLDDLVAGNNVLAIQALNRNAGSSDMLIEAKLETSSVNGLRMPLDPGIFVNPTPGAANGEAFAGLVDEATVSIERGFYQSPISVDLVSPTPGATLVYTTDGSEPSLTNGVQVPAPDANSSAQVTLPISTTTSLRSVAIKTDFVSLGITTNTYIFVDDVIASGVMDTGITQNPQYAPLMEQALLDIPTLSFNYENVITNSNVPEQRASVEWIAPDGSPGFQVDAGIHGFGGYFTNFAKKNFRLHFRGEYGDPRLNFPIFEGHDRGVPVTDSFDALDFRSGSHDMSQRGFYMSNRFTDDTLLDLGHVAPHGRFVHIYINGEYWGQYHMRERWNADFLAQYYGGDEDDYEAINGNVNNGNNTPGGWSPGDVYDGDGVAWDNINALTGNYQVLKQYVNMEDYIDYMLLYMSGSSENEYRAGGSADGSVPYIFYLNDADGWLRGTGNRTGNPGPANILGSLLSEGDPDFLTLYRDRIQNMFFNGGALTPESSIARLQDRLDEIQLSFLAESARWGYRSPSSWENAANTAKTNMLPNIASTMLNHFRAAGIFPVDAPEFNQHGGEVSSGFELDITADIPQLVNNLALFKPATQSSQLDSFGADRAVNASTTDFTHTDQNGDTNPWVEVDLQSESLIETIVVHNRDGSTGRRFYNISVEIRDANNQLVHTTPVFNPIAFGGSSSSSPGDFVEYDLTGQAGGGVNGRYVRVNKTAIGQSNNEEVLSVGEIQVYGETPTGPGSDGIYYTIDGSDPRVSGGSVNLSALLFDDAAPPMITATTTVKTRSLHAGLWSPINQATFIVAPAADMDGDGDVDDADFGIAFAAFTGPNNGPSSNPAADLDGDGDVDDADFGLFFAAFTGPLSQAITASSSQTESQQSALQAEPALTDSLSETTDDSADAPVRFDVIAAASLAQADTAARMQSMRQLPHSAESGPTLHGESSSDPDASSTLTQRAGQWTTGLWTGRERPFDAQDRTIG